MEDHENQEWAWAVCLLVGAVICWHTPFWAADWTGYRADLDMLTDTAMGWEGWLTLLYHIGLIVFGAAIIMTAYLGVIAAALLIWELLVVLARLSWKGLKVAARTIARGMTASLRIIFASMAAVLRFSLALFSAPFRWAFKPLGKLMADRARRREEAAQLRQAYREQYSQDFESFSAFKRYWEKLQAGEDPPYPGREEEERKQREQEEARRNAEDRARQEQEAANRKRRDPYEAAVNLLGLSEPFTRAEMNALYKAAMKKAHPDICGDERKAQRLNMARDLISKRKGWT